MFYGGSACFAIVKMYNIFYILYSDLAGTYLIYFVINNSSGIPTTQLKK